MLKNPFEIFMVPNPDAGHYHIPNDLFAGIGVARGCSGCICTPRAVKKNFRPNLQEKCVSAPLGHEVHPQPEQLRVNF